MVAEPNPGSAPSQVLGWKYSPSPNVETYQTKVADEIVMEEINPITPALACLGIVLPFA